MFCLDQCPISSSDNWFEVGADNGSNGSVTMSGSAKMIMDAGQFNVGIWGGTGSVTMSDTAGISVQGEFDIGALGGVAR